MKRILCVLLSILMLLSLAGCASEQDKALESANALIAEGKYQEAYDALTNQEGYQAYQAQVELAWEKIQEAKGSFLLGTVWKEIDSALELQFVEGGALQFSYDLYGWNEEEPSAMWSYEEGVLKVSRMPESKLEDGGVPTHEVTIEEKDGVTHLTIDGMDFVREEDYAPYEPEIVQITKDNWEDYFELKTEVIWVDGQNGKYPEMPTYICVRDAYVDRVRLDISRIYYSCEYDEVLKEFNADNHNNYFGYTVTTFNKDISMSGKMYDTVVTLNTEDPMNAVAIVFDDGGVNAYNEKQALIAGEARVWYIHGVLMLKP